MTRCIDTFPYKTPEQFDEAPMLLCSDIAKNPFFSDGNLTGDCVCRWQIEPLSLPRLFCMTDALGQWLLSSQEPDAMSRLLELDDCDTFAEFVATERGAGRLKRDDTTLLAFW
jgi:hypothetical protein